MSEEPISLDVGGHEFRTYKSTLMKSEHFKTKFVFKTGDKYRDHDFVDCDHKTFKHILKHLRFNEYKIPLRFKYAAKQFMLPDDAFEKTESDTSKDTIGDYVYRLEGKLSTSNKSTTKTKNTLILMKHIMLNSMLDKICNNGEFIIATIIFVNDIIGSKSYNYCTDIGEYLIRNHIGDETYDNRVRLDLANLYDNCKSYSHNFDDNMRLYIQYFVDTLKNHPSWDKLRIIQCN
jgi:BTB/POZ domain